MPETTPPSEATDPDSALPELEPHRLRLSFAKEGPAAFLGHLDLVRHVPRILRRAGLRPQYSHGYNPRPKLQFTPPLPVGTEGRAELCDVWIRSDGTAVESINEVLPRLNEATLPGLRLTGARWLDVGEPALSKRCQGATYATPLPGSLAMDEARQRVTAALARTTWEVTRKSRRRKQTREVDLRTSLLELNLSKDPDTPGITTLRFSLVGRPEGTLRPREVLAAILGDGELPPLCRETHFSLDNGKKSHLTA